MADRTASARGFGPGNKKRRLGHPVGNPAAVEFSALAVAEIGRDYLVP
jgi:hypothetical protein